MNSNSRPKFDKKNLTFFRKENAKYFSAISPNDPDKAIRILNPTVCEIAELCTGKVTIEQIRLQFVKRYTNDLDSPLKKYVDEALTLLSLYNLITFAVEGTNKNECPKKEIKKLQESEFMLIRNLLNGGRFSEMTETPVFYYIHPIFSMDMLSELTLRNRIFNKKELFYIIKEGAKAVFWISILDARPLKSVGEITTIVGTNNFSFEQGLSEIFPIIVKDVRSLFCKINWYIKTDTNQYSLLINNIDKYGFQKEATLYDEFGAGSHEIIYSKYL